MMHDQRIDVPRLQVHEILSYMNEISQQLTCFDDLEAILPHVLAVVHKVTAVRSAVVVDGHGPSTVVVWHLADAAPEGVGAALEHACQTAELILDLPPGAAAELLRKATLLPPAAITPAQPGEYEYIALPLVLHRGAMFGVLQLEVQAPSGEVVLAFINAVANQLAIALDYAYIVRSRQELAVREEAAAAANAAKTQFLANMSHEIRTPLGAILGYIDLLLSAQTTGRKREEFGVTIRRNGAMLAKLIDDILDLTKVEAGKLAIEKVRFALPEVIAEVRALFAQQAESKNLAFEVDLAPTLPEVIVSDPLRVKQILINVLGNAFKFTGSGTIRLSVDCLAAGTDVGGAEEAKAGASPSRGEAALKIAFTVTDTGPGIAAADAERLFQRFVQADSSITKCFGGTGLGLALSRGLANHLGGDVVLLSSDVGKGSCFRITIDSGMPPTAFVKPVGPARPRSTEPPASSDKRCGSLAGRRILVVEDSPDLQKLFAHMLSNCGAHVDTTDDGVDGVQQALKRPYDVVLMDLQMPRCDGFKATAELRRHGLRTPIIALSAYAMAVDRDRALRAGCDGHLTKPITAQTLIRTLSEVVDNHLH